MSLDEDFKSVRSNLSLLQDEVNQVICQHTYISGKIDEIECLLHDKMHYYNCYLDSIERKLQIATRSQSNKQDGPVELQEFTQEIKEILLRIDEDIDNKLLIFQQNMKNMAIELNMNTKRKIDKLKDDINAINIQTPMEILTLSDTNQIFYKKESSLSPTLSHDYQGKKYLWQIEKITEKLIKEINGKTSYLLSPEIYKDVEGYNYRLSIYLNGYPDYPSYQKCVAIRCRAERDVENIDRMWPTNKVITIVIKNQRNSDDISKTFNHRFQMPGDILFMDQVVGISQVFGNPPFTKQTDYTLNNQMSVLLIFHN